MRSKRTLFSLLLLDFCAVVLIWLFIPTSSSRRLLSAIPSDAAFVSMNRNVAGRLSEFIANPLTRSLLTSTGIDPEELQTASLQPAQHQLIRHLLSGRISLSYVGSGSTGVSRWLVTNQLGWRTTPIRLALACGFIPQTQLIKTYHSFPIYCFQDRSLPTPFFFTIVDGGLIGCLSPQLQDLYAAINRYDQRPGHPLPNSAEEPDCGHLITSSGTKITYAFSTIASNRILGTLSFSNAWPEAPLAVDASELARLLGPVPHAVLVADNNLLLKLLQLSEQSAIAHAMHQFTAHLDTSTSFLSVMTGEYGGSFAGLQLPSLLLGTGPVPADTPTQQLPAYLDYLNAHFKLGLVPEKTPIAGGNTVYVLEGTSTNLYAERPFAERAAYTQCGPMLLADSSSQALIKLAARYERRESQDAVPDTPWLAPLSALHADDQLFVWIDLQRSSKAFRLILSLVTLNMMDSRANEVPAWIGDAKAWIDALAPLEQFTLRAATHGSNTVINFSFGDS